VLSLPEQQAAENAWYAECCGVLRETDPTDSRHCPTYGLFGSDQTMEYAPGSQTEKLMAIQAQRKRARLHVLRDNVHRAKRDVKLGRPGAAERLKRHSAARLAYAQTGK